MYNVHTPLLLPENDPWYALYMHKAVHMFMYVALSVTKTDEINQILFCCQQNGCFCSKMGIPDVEAIGALTPAQSVEQMMKTVSTMSPKDSGRFVSADGSTLPF